MDNLVTAKVTCRTENCLNNGIEIEVLVDANDIYVVCGPCGNQISDIEIGEAE